MRLAALAILISALGASGVSAASSGVDGERAALPATTTGVVFAAAGDHGANPAAAASLAKLDGSGAAFYLALGDIDYNETPSDAAWCDYVVQGLPTLGPTFPFELVAGNHESDDGPDGLIMNHAACLPDRLSSTGTYAAHYYFDYPQTTPVVRTIMISPALTVAGVRYNFALGDADYNWLAATIDEARTARIPWVVVGMHKVCLTAGNKPCEIGRALMNLLIEKKVDLVLQGHDHDYQRSKQLAHSPTGCPAVIEGTYDVACVVDDGSDDSYERRAGPIFVIAGVFGRCCTQVNPNDSEAGYFARMGSVSEGFVQYTVSPSRLDAEFVASTGAFTDSFEIVTPDVNQQDSDGDGYRDSTEHYVGTHPQENCGHPAGPGLFSTSWPADLSMSGPSNNKITIGDVSSFIAPVRRLGSAQGDAFYSNRWDLNADLAVSLLDLTSLSTLAPPMFNKQKAFSGPACTP